LISGIAAGLKTIDPRVRILGCQPENSAVLAASVRAGRILEMPSLPTLSDATAGGLEPGSVTLPLCRELVDDFILLSEKEISDAVRWIIDRCHMLVEGAAALPVAALLRRPESFAGRRAVLILSGCRIGVDTLKKIL
jgi:threonine dehydratase